MHVKRTAGWLALWGGLLLEAGKCEGGHPPTMHPHVVLFLPTHSLLVVPVACVCVGVYVFSCVCFHACHAVPCASPFKCSLDFVIIDQG